VGRYTEETQRWLDGQFSAASPDGVFRAHQPIYGVTSPLTQSPRLYKVARTFRILRVLDALEFGSFLDVGAAEGYLAALVKRVFDARVLGVDLSTQACHRAWQVFGVEAAAIDGPRLPFAAGAFDVVCCSEVIEHVEFPVELLLELDRVAARAVLVTTEQSYADRAVRDRFLAKRGGLPHEERNHFHHDDFATLLGSGVSAQGQLLPIPEIEPSTVEDAARWIRRAIAVEGREAESFGVVALKAKRPSGERRRSDDALLKSLLEFVVPAAPLSPDSRRAPSAEQAALLRCVACGAALDRDLACTRCGRRVAADGGVPRCFAGSGADPTRASTEARLRAAWPGEDARVRAALELRDRLELADETRREWDFSKPADRSRWQANDQLVPRDGAAGAFRWRSVGADPWIASPRIGVPCCEVREIEIELRVHNPRYPKIGGHSQVYWLTDRALEFAEERSILFAPLNDGEMHRYSVRVADHPAWPRDGVLVCVRIDPAAGEGEIDLASIALR
jgi:SAM-dependent methyltransferase